MSRDSYSRGMIVAATGAVYDIVELLHVLTVVVALSPAFVHPLLRRQLLRSADPNQQQLLASMAGNVRRLYSPMLIVSGLLGIALVEMSEDAHSMTDGWVIAVIVIWLVMNGLLHGMITPALRAAGAGTSTSSSERRLERASAAMTILFVVQLFLMIFQPGS